MLGDKASQLINDYARSKNEPLPPYQHELVNSIVDEIKELFEANQRDA